MYILAKKSVTDPESIHFTEELLVVKLASYRQFIWVFKKEPILAMRLPC